MICIILHWIATVIDRWYWHERRRQWASWGGPSQTGWR